MKQEFKLKNCRLDYPDISVFTTSPVSFLCAAVIGFVSSQSLRLHIGIVLHLGAGTMKPSCVIPDGSDLKTIT